MRKRELIALHKRLCRELGIKPARVTFGTESEETIAYYHPGSRKIKLFMGTCYAEGYDPREVIAHETYHHYQRVTGWLGWCTKRGVQWKGRDNRDWWFKSYRQKPWEAGAFRYQRKIAAREGW